MKIEDVYLSTKPEKALGTKQEWDRAEKDLASALKKAGWKHEINPGDGAFYGPKIDMSIKDVLGRKWQLATIQLDFQMPQRFKLEYVDADGTRKTPIVIHRAILGSFERFMAILIEHFGGAFPAWLAPVQAAVLPITDKQNKYAREVVKNLKAAGVRVEIDERNESIGKKIREAEMQKVPYMLIIGEKEVPAKGGSASGGKVAVRGRNQKDLGAIKLDKFVKLLTEEIAERKI
jgi:threonyl-tRNA synthetase